MGYIELFNVYRGSLLVNEKCIIKESYCFDIFKKRRKNFYWNCRYYSLGKYMARGRLFGFR